MNRLFLHLGIGALALAWTAVASAQAGEGDPESTQTVYIDESFSSDACDGVYYCNCDATWNAGGWMQLTPAAAGKMGTLIHTNMVPSSQVLRSVRFRFWRGNGSAPPADGLCLSINNIANHGYEDCWGDGGPAWGEYLNLRIVTYQSPQGMILEQNGNTLASTGTLPASNVWHTAELLFDATGASVTVEVDGNTVLGPVAITPLDYHKLFGLGARTGGLWEEHRVDDLHVETWGTAAGTVYLLAPLDGSTVRASSVELQALVSSDWTSPVEVKFFGYRVGTLAPFTFVALPDTQYYCRDGTSHFAAQTQWIANNVSGWNIGYVAHVGDIVDTASNWTQWTRADAALDILDGTALPFALEVGNHDQNPNGNPDGTGNFNSWFGYSRYQGRPWYGGHYGSDNDNNYVLFSAGGMDFVSVQIEYEGANNAAVMAWAGAVLDTYANRRAIVVSHDLIYPDGQWSELGLSIYNALKDHPNLFLMLCGHWTWEHNGTGEAVRSDVYAGRTIHTLLSDYQGRANGGDGWLRLMKFYPDSDDIQVYTYSPTRNEYETDADSQFSVSCLMAPPLAAQSNVQPGATVSHTWPNLQVGSAYKWYATAYDGLSTAVSPVWSFVVAPPGGFDANLLVNPGAELYELTGWTVTASGGSGWGAMGTDWLTPHSGSHSFGTSWDWDARYQEVDLLAAGFTAAQLDASPTVEFGEWVRSRTDSACSYFIRFELLNAAGQVIQAWEHGTQAAPITLPTGVDWFQEAHTFSGFGSGLRYVRIHDGGRSANFWSGWYGAYFDDASVVLRQAGCTPPTITTQPQSQSRCAGQSVTFSVAAGGTSPFSYQWRKNSTNISGATSASYTITTVISGDVGNYDCVVTNACGAATSNAATLTVNTAPSITTQPQSQTKCVGQPVTFTVAASGTPTYQWRKNGTNISGATSASYTIAGVTTGDAGNYDCVVTNACGAATSNAATLTVNTAPSITTQPQSQSKCVGQPVTFTVVATGTPTYQWRKNGTSISGATSASYTIAAVATGDAGSYDCVVTNSCGAATSNAATLTVNTAPSITTQPQSQSKCVGQPVTFTVVATGTPTYQWRKNGTNISGATSASYTIASVTTGDAGNYDCVVTNACGSATSNAATLTVSTAPSITTQPQSQSRCVGQSVTFVTIASGTPAPSYQWRKNGTNISGATSASYTIPAVTLGDAGSYDCVATNTCGSATSNVATLTVNSVPTITGQPQSATRHTGQTVSFSVTASGASPLTYQWRKNGVPIAGATVDTYTIAAVATGDAGNYNCVVGSPCGSVASSVAVLTVWLTGDLDCSGVVEFGDINPFVAAVSDPVAYQAAYPNCNYLNGDCDFDGDVDFNDINAFVMILQAL